MALTPRSDHMVKHFFAKLFLCEHIVPLVGKKSVAVQPAMLVHFLLLLCAHKEVEYKQVLNEKLQNKVKNHVR